MRAGAGCGRRPDGERVKTNSYRGHWLVTGLLAACVSARGAGEARFYGGGRDGYEKAGVLAVAPAIRSGWYTGGGGDGDARARFLQVAESLPRGWYVGSAGDGYVACSFASLAGSAPLRWFNGGPRDGSARTAIAGLTNPLDRDSDSDGLPDWWELAYGEDLTVLHPGDDPDRDDFINVQEDRAGTVPTNAASLLRLEAMVIGETQPLLTWQSVDARRYRLERATNLQAGFSVLIKTNILGVAPMNTETDTTAVGGGPWFYRVKLE